jgi:hypothetical protein
LTVEITEGRLIWQQSVGIPGKQEGMGSFRTISLLIHRLPERTDLYLRIEDKSAGIIYCTHRLGDFIAYGKPDVLLDAENTIYILQNTAPRQFVYSKVGLNGKILERISYEAPKDRPHLKLFHDGSIAVVGGIPFDPHATPTPTIIPKLSDRPLALPMESPSPQALSKTAPKSAKKKTTPQPSPSPVKID